MNSDSRGPGNRNFLGVVAAIAGPAIAGLYEQGALLGREATLAPLAIVVAVAGLGLGIGVWASLNRPRWGGLLAIFTNGIVVLLYGFLLVFFGLGGSR